ncbi:hypothetical protein ACTFIZ_001845 [Dictyostelium cf. discoideum]
MKVLQVQTEFVNNLVGTLAERTGIEVDMSHNTSNKRVLNEPPYIHHNRFYHHSNLNQKQKLNNTISAPQPKNYVIEAIGYDIPFTIINDHRLNDKITVIIPLLYHGSLYEKKDKNEQFFIPGNPWIKPISAGVEHSVLVLDIVLLSISVKSCRAHYTDELQFDQIETYKPHTIKINLPTQYIYKAAVETVFNNGTKINNNSKFIIYDCSIKCENPK